MTEYYFKEEMKRMYSLFGEKSYPEERLKSIWRTCQTLPNESFRGIVNRFVDSSKAAPLPDEFKKLAYEEKKRLGIEIKEPESKPSAEAQCWDCGDSGNLKILRRETFEAWAKFPEGTIRCQCEVGQKRPVSQGPIWNSQIAKSYTIDPVYPDLKGDWLPKPHLTLVKMMRLAANNNRSESGDLSSAADIFRDIR